jgi:hypothetical protein
MSANILVWVEQFKGQAASASWEAMGLAREHVSGKAIAHDHGREAIQATPVGDRTGLAIALAAQKAA